MLTSSYTSYGQKCVADCWKLKYGLRGEIALVDFSIAEKVLLQGQLHEQVSYT